MATKEFDDEHQEKLPTDVIGSGKIFADLSLPVAEDIKVLRVQFKLVSVEKLMRMLTEFDQDMEIAVKPHRRRGEASRITFIPAA